MTDRSEQFPDLPPYTYVPGYAPHPASDSEGHMRDFSLPSTWTLKNHFLWGVRLFRNGYYWEAHEAWEHLWLELGRTSEEALTVKGLIKLAAAAVKCREGNSVGAQRHATRAAELLSSPSDSELFRGLSLADACESAMLFAASPPVDHTPPSDRPVRLPGLRFERQGSEGQLSEKPAGLSRDDACDKPE